MPRRSCALREILCTAPVGAKGGCVMRRLLIMFLALLLGFSPWLSPAATRAAGGADDLSRRVPSPYAGVGVQGQLDKDPLAHEAPFYGTFSTGWIIHGKGWQFHVDFGGNKELMEKAAKLVGKKVLLSGNLEMREYRIPEFWTGPY